MSRQDIAPESSWLEGNYLKTTKLYLKNKIKLGDFNNTMVKMDKDGGNKTQGC